MSRISPTKFSHVFYRTRRFQQMLRWYQIVFNARVQYQNPALAFLSYDDEHHRIALANLDVMRPDAIEKDRSGLVGVDHLAYSYDSIDDLLLSYTQLKEQGIKPYWCVHHGITISMYYADPDGNQMEFQVDCFASHEEAVAYMTSPSFGTSPGVEFDPEEWLAQVRDGTPASEFLTRQTEEPVSPLRGSIVA